MVEIGGPEQFHMDELVRRVLQARDDPRKVLADPQAGYFGTSPTGRDLVPDVDAVLGPTYLEDWVQPAGCGLARFWAASHASKSVAPMRAPGPGVSSLFSSFAPK